jgi:hypothetical protein
MLVICKPLSKYIISADDISGNGFINGMQFTTMDRDQDFVDNSNCAQQYNGGWWFESCHNGNLNGLYGYDNTSYATGWTGRNGGDTTTP